MFDSDMSESPVLVAGAGAWGSALACVFARTGRETFLWDSDEEVIRGFISAHGRRGRVLAPDREELIKPIINLEQTDRVSCVVVAVPFQALRQVLARLSASLPDLPAVACASKGLENPTGMMAHEIVADIWTPDFPFAQLSGPNFAGEVLQNLPAAITIAATKSELGQELAGAMHGSSFRPYCTDDIIGVELGGALKNVIAIAVGIADGLELGANTRAALMTRGLAEIARIGVARGGRLETFMGLSGIGDLVLTCTDDQSRNRRFGLAFARLKTVDAAASEVGALVEGMPTAEALITMAKNSGIEVPIAAEVMQILSGETHPEEAAHRLLTRDLVSETA